MYDTNKNGFKGALGMPLGQGMRGKQDLQEGEQGALLAGTLVYPPGLWICCFLLISRIPVWVSPILDRVSLELSFGLLGPGLMCCRFLL